MKKVIISSILTTLIVGIASYAYVDYNNQKHETQIKRLNEMNIAQTEYLAKIGKEQKLRADLAISVLGLSDAMVKQMCADNKVAYCSEYRKYVLPQIMEIK